MPWMSSGRAAAEGKAARRQPACYAQGSASAGRAGTCRGGTLPAARARAAGRRGCWSWASGACPRHAAGSGSDAWGLVARGGAGARPRWACSGWREAWVYGRLGSAGRAASGWRAGRGRVAEGRCRLRELGGVRGVQGFTARTQGGGAMPPRTARCDRGRRPSPPQWNRHWYRRVKRKLQCTSNSMCPC